MILCLLSVLSSPARAVCPQFAVAMSALDEATHAPRAQAPGPLQDWVSRVGSCLTQNAASDTGACMGLVCEGIRFRNEKLDPQQRAAYNNAVNDLAEAGLSEANIECFYPEQGAQ